MKGSAPSEVAERSMSQLVPMAQGQFPHLHCEEIVSPESRDWPSLAGAPSPQSSTGDTMTAPCSLPIIILTDFLYRKSLLSRGSGWDGTTHFGWFWCSHCFAASISWNGIISTMVGLPC